MWLLGAVFSLLLCVCISVSQRRVVFLDSAEAVAVGLCSDKLAWCFGGTRFGLHRAGAHDADTAAVAHARSTAALLDSPNSQNHDMCHDVRGSSWTTQPARPGGRGTVGPAASAGDLRLRGEGVGNGLWVMRGGLSGVCSLLAHTVWTGLREAGSRLLCRMWEWVRHPGLPREGPQPQPGPGQVLLPLLARALPRAK